jgi:hypothetical protein
MPLTATNRYFNFGLFSFGGTAITGIQSFGYDVGISDKQEGGDGDPGPTVSIVDWVAPSFQFSTNDAFALSVVPPGTKGIFIATLLDAYNKAATGWGGKIITTNALSYFKSDGIAGQYRDFLKKSTTVQTTWGDPATFPASISPL